MKSRKFLFLFLSLGGVMLASFGGFADSEKVPASRHPDKEEIYRRVYNGWKWWHVYCYRCHGVDALGSPLAKNLRDSVRVMSYEEVLHTVREGRPKKGMQSWKLLLDDRQITDIYIYVMARSEKVLPPGRPDEIGENEGPWVPPDNWPNFRMPSPPRAVDQPLDGTKE